MSDDKKIVKIQDYRNRGKVLTFPKDRAHLQQETFESKLDKIKDSLNKINKLYADLKDDKKKD